MAKSQVNPPPSSPEAPNGHGLAPVWQERRYRGRTYGCPVQLALGVISGKWKTAILWRFLYAGADVHNGTLRFNELRAMLPAISAKVLTEKLRELEDDGIILRHAEPGRAAYGFTELGARLMPAMRGLEAWASEFEERLKARGVILTDETRSDA